MVPGSSPLVSFYTALSECARDPPLETWHVSGTEVPEKKQWAMCGMLEKARCHQGYKAKRGCQKREQVGRH